jgi:DDE superfamily endonuclease
MNTTLMVEWLRAFYTAINPGRSVLLLIDNLKAHITGVKLAPPPPNIRIQWLPPNATSLYQPLDQGILQNLKHHYKKCWLQYIIQQYEQQINPLGTMNLYFAICWITQAWASDVTESTIYRYFRKSKILPCQQPISLPQDLSTNLLPLLQTVERVGQIRDIISLSNFLNPSDENLEPSDGNQEIDLDEIIQLHTEEDPQDEEAVAENETLEIPVPSSGEALQAVKLLLRYQDHQAITTTGDIRHLLQLQRSIQLDMVQKQRQGQLDTWLR